MSLAKPLIKSFFKNISLTYWLIFFNILAFIFFLIFPGFVGYFALKPEDIIQGKNVWSLLTHMFMHAGFFHLFFNMFTLFFIGNFIEKIIGRKRFFWFYLLSGLLGGIFFVLAGILGLSNPEIYGVGASGAIFGLLGLLAVLTPKARVYLIAGPLIAIVLLSIVEAIFGTIEILSLVLNIYFLISLFAIFSFNTGFRKLALPVEMPLWILPIIAIVPLTIIGYFVELPIGNSAHLGGLVIGLIYGWYLASKYKKKIKMLRKMIR
ncbi:MAG: rhomboid family intramembrane serine protease [Candidatus Pacearchaeota archaeon]|nr:rhomboid family intramembrane serine protease [Candidatus Pacearchaeota archaeon]